MDERKLINDDGDEAYQRVSLRHQSSSSSSSHSKKSKRNHKIKQIVLLFLFLCVTAYLVVEIIEICEELYESENHVQSKDAPDEFPDAHIPFIMLRPNCYPHCLLSDLSLTACSTHVLEAFRDCSRSVTTIKNTFVLNGCKHGIPRLDCERDITGPILSPDGTSSRNETFQVDMLFEFKGKSSYRIKGPGLSVLDIEPGIHAVAVLPSEIDAFMSDDCDTCPPTSNAALWRSESAVISASSWTTLDMKLDFSPNFDKVVLEPRVEYEFDDSSQSTLRMVASFRWDYKGQVTSVQTETTSLNIVQVVALSLVIPMGIYHIYEAIHNLRKHRHDIGHGADPVIF